MAVAVTTSALCCLNIQQVLDDRRNPGLIMESQGFLDALVSPENTRGFEQITFFEEKARPGANALPKTEIVYRKPSCGTVTSTVGALCDTATATTDRKGYLEPTIDLVSAISGSFTKADFDQLCENPSERLVMDLEDAANDLRKDMNIKLINAAYPLMGNYANGDASIGANAETLNIINSDGFANVPAFAELKRNFKKMHTTQAPIIVAGEIGGMYEDIRQMGGTGANSLNASASNPFNLYYDNDLDTEIQALAVDTASHALSWIPGALQRMEWYQFKGYREELGKDDYSETTITINGETYDYTLAYDKCTHEWVWTLTKQYGLFYIPDAAYTPCYDFNQKLHWKFACGAFDCTQINIPAAVV